MLNQFCVFQQELLHSPNELSGESCQYIDGDVSIELWLFQKVNKQMQKVQFCVSGTNYTVSGEKWNH